MRADESERFIYRLLWPVWGHPRWPKSNWWISNCLRVAVDLSSWSNNRWRYCCCCCRPSPRKYYRPRCSYSIDNKRQLACCCCCNSAISSCSRMKRPTPSTMISWDIEDSLPLLIRFDSIFPPSFTALVPLFQFYFFLNFIFMFPDLDNKKRKKRHVRIWQLDMCVSTHKLDVTIGSNATEEESKKRVDFGTPPLLSTVIDQLMYGW